MKSDDPLSVVFSALADPTRREILSRLTHGSTTVGELSAPLALSAPAVSRHLKVLESAGLITRTTTAQWRTISLRPAPLADATSWIDRQQDEWNRRLDSFTGYVEGLARDNRKEEQ